MQISYQKMALDRLAVKEKRVKSDEDWRRHAGGMIQSLSQIYAVVFS